MLSRDCSLTIQLLPFRLIAFLILLCAAASSADAQLHFSAGAWSFGTLEHGESADRSFEVENRGETAYTVDFISTCDCISISPLSVEVPPGTRESFTVSFDSTGYSGNIRKDFIVRSDSPNLAKALFSVTGRVIEAPDTARAAAEPVRPVEDPAELEDPPELEDHGEEKEDRAQASRAEPQAEIEYYYTAGCRECTRFIEETMPKVIEQAGSGVRFSTFDISSPEHYETLLARLTALDEKLVRVPVLIAGERVLQGSGEIESGAAELAARAAASGPAPVRTDSSGAEAGEERRKGKSPAISGTELVTGKKGLVRRLSIPGVFGAGLIDGINPCAFATLVFLISALQVAGRSRKDIVLIGSGFVGAVFATYYLIGLGFFEVLRVAVDYAVVGRVIDALLVAVLAVLAALSFYDFIQARRGAADKMVLQLSMNMKRRIHSAIRGRVRSTGILLASLTMGFLVSLFELGCTGQIYLPTVTYMVRSEIAAGYLFLLLYNAAFIIPLAAVFTLSYAGVSSKTMGSFLTANLPWVKLATVLLFAALALGIVLL